MMTDGWPKIKARRTMRISPWVRIIEREVEFEADSPSELYHAVDQQDYISIVARTPDGMMPIVRQYRPAQERFTWELPAGLVDDGEEAAEACRRELLEETGLIARAVHALGIYSPCTSRLSNRVFPFFVETEASGTIKASEPGIEVKLVSIGELMDLIRSGEFVLQLHIGALMLAAIHGHLVLEAFCPVAVR